MTSTDTDAPTLEWSGLPALVADSTAFTAELSFNENVSGLTLGDFISSNATLSGLNEVDATTYTVLITPDGGGDIALSLPANSVQDAANNGNSSSAAPIVLFDGNAIALSLVNVPSIRPDTTSYSVSFEFSAGVIGFDVTDIAVVNGVVSNFSTTSSSDYSADITPDGTGDITITVPAQSATAVASSAQTQSATATTIYNISAPTVDISGAPAVINTTATFVVGFQFSEDVTNFDTADISITNAALSNFQSTDSNTYSVEVTPTGVGNIVLNIAADTVHRYCW